MLIQDDAACIVAKAIHDNVIEATIDFEQRCVCSNDSSLNMYSTEGTGFVCQSHSATIYHIF
jgi:hypothetical protein